MSIEIRILDDLYEASVRPPHGRVPWDSPHPMRVGDLIDALLALGCHQTDIGDALFEADPDWGFRYRPFSEDE